MAAVRLVFNQQRHSTGNPVPLVFGAGGDAPQERYTVTAAGRVTGLRGSVRVATLARVRAAGRITLGLRGGLQLGWNVNVSRPVVGAAADCIQDGLPARAGTQALWQQAQPLQVGVTALLQDARKVASQVQQLWQQAQRLASAAQDVVQDAAAIRSSTSQGMQEGLRVRSAAGDRLQDAVPMRSDVLQGFQQALRRRGQLASGFQQGVPMSSGLLVQLAQGIPVRVDWRGRLQQAIKPGPGQWRPKPVPDSERCYVPGLPAALVFRQPWAADGRLVFICCKGSDPEPQPTPQYVIPLLPVYMQVHHLTAHLLPSLEPVVLTDVTIAADDDSYCWSLSANGPEHLLDQLAPVGGLPPRLQIGIDGMQFVFAVTSTARSRAFDRRRVAVQGVSVTAMLGAPYMPQQNWLASADATAQQLAVTALEHSGVSLDWQIADWLVPAGAWSFQGTPLQAVLRVAESVNAVVRSHRTAEQLIIAPRYPVLPWEWGAAVPDVQMPAAVIVTDELRPDPRAEYNAIYVTGGSVGGVLGHVVRSLSARDKLAPQIQDDLITHADAARMRGSWALAASGNKLQHSISMPVLTGGTNPGILNPGQLLEVADTDGTWRGLVRGVSVSASLPKVRQQVTVERVAA